MTYSDASRSMSKFETWKIQIKNWHKWLIFNHLWIHLESFHHFAKRAHTCEEFQGGTHRFVGAQGDTPSARSKSFSTQGAMPQVFWSEKNQIGRTVFCENGAENYGKQKKREQTVDIIQWSERTCIYIYSIYLMWLLWISIVDEYRLIMVELCCFVFLVGGRCTCVCLSVLASWFCVFC